MEVPSPVGEVKVASPISNFVRNTLTLKYSQTSLLRTPKGQNQVSTLQKCPYYKGRECMIFGFSGTKRTVRKERLHRIDVSFPAAYVSRTLYLLQKLSHVRIMMILFNYVPLMK